MRIVCESGKEQGIALAEVGVPGRHTPEKLRKQRGTRRPWEAPIWRLAGVLPVRKWRQRGVGRARLQKGQERKSTAGRGSDSSNGSGSGSGLVAARLSWVLHMKACKDGS